MVLRLIGTRFPIIQSMAAKRGVTNRANVHIPMHGRNPSSNFGCNWTSFHSRHAGLRRRCVWRQETGHFYYYYYYYFFFFGGLWGCQFICQLHKLIENVAPLMILLQKKSRIGDHGRVNHLYIRKQSLTIPEAERFSV